MCVCTDEPGRGGAGGSNGRGAGGGGSGAGVSGYDAGLALETGNVERGVARLFREKVRRGEGEGLGV